MTTANNFPAPVYDKIREALESDDCNVSSWNIDRKGCYVEIETDNGWGEDLIVTYSFDYDEIGDNFLEDAFDVVDSFDLDSYVRDWLNAKQYGREGVPDVETLVSDGKENLKIYKRIAEIIRSVVKNNQ